MSRYHPLLPVNMSLFLWLKRGNAGNSGIVSLKCLKSMFPPLSVLGPGMFAQLSAHRYSKLCSYKCMKGTFEVPFICRLYHELVTLVVYRTLFKELTASAHTLYFSTTSTKADKNCTETLHWPRKQCIYKPPNYRVAHSKQRVKVCIRRWSQMAPVI